MLKKLFVTLVLTLLVIGTLFGVVSAKTYEIRLGHGTATTSLYHYGAKQFKEIVEERTDGNIKVEIYPSGQIGHDRDLTEGMQMGTIEMGLIGTEPLTTFAPKISVINLPFLFKDRKHAYAVLDGQLGKDIMAPLKEQGLINLGFFENGFRMITNSAHKVKTPEDLNGLKLRTPNSPVSLAIFKALGANPTPMNFGEVYTALQQGTIDGQENPLALISSAKFYEVNKYITLSGHIYSPCVLLISEKFYSSLPEDYQEIVLEAGAKARDMQRLESIRREEKLIKDLKEKGAVITDLTPEQRAKFVEATDDVWKKFADEFGGEEFYRNIKNFDYSDFYFNKYLSN